MAKDTRTRMLETTALLLRQRGYHGTSLNDILSTSGAPRGSLYFHFPDGKDQLVVEVTRDSVEKVTQRLGEALAAEADPAVAVHHIYQAIGRMLEENEFTLGCPIDRSRQKVAAPPFWRWRLCRLPVQAWPEPVDSPGWPAHRQCCHSSAQCRRARRRR